MSEGGYDLAVMVAQLLPRRIVELGTGDGYTAARLMLILPEGGTLTCVNWPNPPSGDRPWRYLEPWRADPRLDMVFGDTRDPAVVARAPDDIDFLIIDSTHTAECAAEEWRLYRPKLAEGATVVCDDIDHNDMRSFWDALPYDKREYRNNTVGVFRYESERHVH